ncbi:LacI family DNA-binding transcriptional regulator [Agromyces tropicus]|uniref:LacI family DNA-binding transcriptional regulator n=1 Tax=Agromyces tropicus TaxID=555371 RepID=A0ABN2UYR1_9MICO
MPKRVTMDDVAKLAEVHKATVSRALDPRTRDQVNAETVKRVKRAARQLGYVPNAMARGLRTSSSMTVGVIIPDLMNPIFPPIVRGIERLLQPRGYTALLANTDGDDEVELSAFESLLQRRVDGFILATGRLGEQPMLRRARESGVPIVMVNRTSETGDFPVVTGDQRAGVEAALRHLFDLGHRRITHLAGPPMFSTTKARAEAFRSICAAEPGVDGDVVEAAALTADAGEAAMDRIIATGACPTAVLAGNDLVALGAIRAMRAHDLRVPEDVSIVGFNDMPFAADFSPALTTVHVPLQEIGAEAARLLLSGIADAAQQPVTVSMPVEFVVRASTAPVHPA